MYFNFMNTQKRRKKTTSNLHEMPGYTYTYTVVKLEEDKRLTEKGREGGTGTDRGGNSAQIIVGLSQKNACACANQSDEAISPSRLIDLTKIKH